MKLSLTLLFAALLSISASGQRFKELNITKTDGTATTTNGVVVYENDFGVKINTESGTFIPSQILYVQQGDQKFITKVIDGKPYLIEELIAGELSLYKGNLNYYLDHSTYGFRQIPERENTIMTTFKSGTVSVYINNCKATVELLAATAESLTIAKLKDLTNTYNTCEIQEEVQISENALKQSQEPDEKIEFGLSLGFMHMNTDFSTLTEVQSTNIGMASFGAIVYFHSNLFNNNLDVNFSVDYFATADQVIQGSDYTIYSESKLINLLVGFNYVFNNTKSIFKPYAGLSGGVLFNSGSSVILDPVDTTQPIDTFDGLNMLTYNFNIGSVIYAFNQKFDVLLAYQPGLEMRLEKNNDIQNAYETYYDSSSFNLRLTYVF